jgi:hypothetical protein
MEDLLTGSDMEKYLRKLVDDGVPIELPLKCKIDRCTGTYSSIKSFAHHVTAYHELPKTASATQNTPNDSLLDVFQRTDDTVMDVDLLSETDSDDVSISERDPAEFYDKKVTEILLNAFSNSSIPHEFIAEMIQTFEEYVTDVGENLKKIHVGFSKKQGNASDMIASLDFEMQQVVAALTRVNTPYKAKNLLLQHPLFVEPEIIPLSFRREAHLQNGNVVSNKLIAEQFSYMSIIKTIKCLFSDKEFAELILNEAIDRSPFYPWGCYESFTDGSNFRNHVLFSDSTKTVLRIQMFYDGMGTTNPLRGHSASHNLGIFYFTIQNLPNSFNTCFPNIHTFAICHSLDLKKWVSANSS